MQVDAEGQALAPDKPDPWAATCHALAGASIRVRIAYGRADLPAQAPIRSEPTFAPVGKRHWRHAVRGRVAVVGAGSATTLAVAGLLAAVLVAPHQAHSTPKAVEFGAAPVTTSTDPTTTTTQPATPIPAPAVTEAMSYGYPPTAITDPSPVATASVSSLPLYSSPAAATPFGHLANPNYLGAALVMLVTAFQGNWVQAYVPQRPNESTAWFPASDVTISYDPYHIDVSLSGHQLVLYKDNAPVYSAPVASGAPDSPTPTGSYFVAYIVKLTDPDNVYGPYAMGTSAFSNTYYSFEGGPGQIGIHGTDQPWVIGSYASHGCIRLNNNDITAVATQIPPGTPVEIGP
ncbi:MAG TPA: L,D-transpeptidase [Acidimicrobiales bacterium]|nr:L,D-transpeptidase [Acidimicrobiales bacterium]